VTELAVDIAGWFGAFALLSGYALVSTRRVSATSVQFQALNVGGAVGLLVNATYHGAWPSAALNVVWLVIAGTALTRLQAGRVPPSDR
jgi:hypothetical protein